MTSSNASPRARSTARGFSLALGPWMPAALGCAMVLLAGVHRAAAGINVWTSLGPLGGDVRALAIDPITPGTLYAGTGDGDKPGSVFKSTDGGGTWSASGLNGYIVALAIDPTTPDTLYASAYFNGVFKSTDGGSTWNRTGLPFDRLVNVLAIDPTTPGTLYAGTGFCGCVPLGEGCGCGGGVFKSTDGGATWNATDLTNTAVVALAIDPTTPGTLYAGTVDCPGWSSCAGSVFKSTDGGVTWNATGLTNTRVQWDSIGLGPGPPALAIAIDPTTPGTLYVGTDGDGIVKSTDAGDTWNDADTGLPDNTSVTLLAIDPTAPATLYAGTDGGVFKSTDGGGTWTPLNAGLIVGAFAVDPTTPATLYAGTFGGVFKSTDGASTWVATGFVSTPSPRYVHVIAIDPAMPSTLYAGANDVSKVSKSTDGGATWIAVDTGLPDNAAVTDLAIDPMTPGTLYAGVGDPWAGVFKSTNGGGIWQATGLATGLSIVLAIDPITPGTLYAGTYDGRIFKSTDAGDTWNDADTGLPDKTSVTLLAIDPTAPETIYAGTDRGGGVFKSTDGGGTWDAILPGYVAALAIDPISPATLYAATVDCDGSGCAGGVLKSTDAGASWTLANTGLSSVYVSTLVIDPSTPSTLYAGTDGGVFKSTDAGATWEALNTGWSGPPVGALAIDPAAPGRLYAGTEGGVFAIQQVGSCAGDCNDSRNTRVNEIVTLVSIALGTAPPAVCPHGVLGSGAVDIALLVEAVNNALGGCRFTAQ